MIKIVYLDEEAGWQSTVYAVLSSKYEVHIPESLPHDVSQIWDEIRDSQLAIVDFRLNGDGILSYTGDDVAREIHKHNKADTTQFARMVPAHILLGEAMASQSSVNLIFSLLLSG